MWTGDSCQKKDVSVPFALLGGTGLVLILLGVGTVALLAGVGMQELPKTLTSGAQGGHLKSD